MAITNGAKNNDTCPHCEADLRRTHRTAWMRLLPFSKFYVCESNHHRYLRFLGMIFKV
jgi:uncharacterized protein with PIN domain